MSEWRPSQDSQRSGSSKVLSHGRGGAGNIGYDPKDDDTPDFATPTIKGDIYTTGRGGTGNMAKNNDPDLARLAQDVSEAPPRLSEADFHYGRGGAANIGKPTDAEILAAKVENARWKLSGGDMAPVDHSKIDYRGWADKGKDALLRRIRK
ncbi:MAG: hypothetical protein M1840_001045 [Geoglossum simile]|nr:MAG: hypothetical protein M1840_001045 [Geoglossum simile]